MIDSDAIIKPLHEAYVSSTGLSLEYTPSRRFAWERWMFRKWNKEDLFVVVRHLKTKIRNGQKWPSCLSFNRLIGDEDAFEEQLAEARALARTPKPHPARQEVKSNGKLVKLTPETPARSAADILAADKAFAAFRDLRKSL
jgi:hypothetical protein